MRFFVVGALGIGSFCALAEGAVLRFSDNFNRANGAVGNNWELTSTDTSGTVPSAAIVSNTAFIDNNAQGGTTQLIQDSSGAVPSTGYVLANDVASGQKAVWSFNMRHHDADLSSTNNIAFILGGTNGTLTSGDGYAVYRGENNSGSNSSGNDPIRLVRYTGGIGGTRTTLVNTPFSGTGSVPEGTQYLNVKVEYARSTNTWELFLTTSTTAFSDPGSLGAGASVGTAVDSTYTSSTLVAFGASVTHTTGGAKDMSIDNVAVAVPEPATLALVGLGSLVGLRCRRVA
jgi:hypothetical protein